MRSDVYQCVKARLFRDKRNLEASPLEHLLNFMFGRAGPLFDDQLSHVFFREIGFAGRAQQDGKYQECEKMGSFHFERLLQRVGQGSLRTTRTDEAGFFSSLAVGRIGRRTSSPPQLGQMKRSLFEAQSRQNVHSKVQM